MCLLNFLPHTEVTRFVMITETVTSTVTVTPTPQGTRDLLSIVTMCERMQLKLKNQDDISSLNCQLKEETLCKFPYKFLWAYMNLVNKSLH